MLSCVAGLAAAALLAVTPAKAVSYNANFETIDQVNGFNFNLGLTTDAGNNLTAATGFVTGLGVNAGYSGPVTGLLLPGSNGLWNWDNKFSGTSPYFTPSDCCSGIVLTFNTLSFGNDIVNLYTVVSGLQDFASFLNPSTGYNPGFELNLANADVSATPSPASWSLFVGGLGVFGGFMWLRKKKAGAAGAIPAIA